MSTTTATKTTGVVRTVYGLKLQAALLQQTVLSYAEHSTMNEKLDIQAGVYPADGIYPYVGFYALGIGGAKVNINPDGLLLFDNYQHEVDDAMPFRIVPLVLRELSNDLSITERANYALRTIVPINGIKYYAYYLRRLDLTGVAPMVIKKTVTNGIASATIPWTPDSSVLSPEPTEYTATDAAIMDGTYLMVTAANKITLSLSEINELLNVGEILYGDGGYMNITEVALVSAVDKTVTVDSNGTAVAFKEAIAAQVNNFIPTTLPLLTVNDNFELDIDLGGGEPMYVSP